MTMRRPWRTFAKIVVVLLLLLVGAAGLAAGVICGVLSSSAVGLPAIDRLQHYHPDLTTRILAADGSLIGTLFRENRTYAPLTAIPPVMRHAIVSIEDRRFYEHHGVDFQSVVRAAWSDLRHEQARQGASTLTQQLARNIFLTPKKTLQRKIQEALLALQIEQRYTKDEILEMYLNQVYFGAGAYGVEAAAQTYFGIPASRLSLAQASLLAGLPQAPSQYSPYTHLKASKTRQKSVLDAMVSTGAMTRDQADRAYAQRLILAPPRGNFEFHTYKTPYFTLYVLQDLFSRYDEDLLFRGGLTVYTTLNPKLQAIAQKTVTARVKEAIAGHNAHQGALVALEPNTGFIRVMVGGTGFSPTAQFNRAWQARRQPGSSFKIFVYTTAIDNGYTPDTIVSDTRIIYPQGPGQKPWEPKDDDHRYMGAIPLHTALQFSRNIVSVRLVDALTPQRVISYAYKMGIKEPLEPNLSLALGSSVVTVLDMASAAGVLANGGVRVEPTAIKKIVAHDGEVLEDHTFARGRQVIPARTAYTMVTMMKRVIEAGTGTRAQIGRPAAGKTGTTDEFRDTWFVGFVPNLVCVVWVGNDDYSRMWQAYGGIVPASIWADFMKQALKGKPVKDFEEPTGSNYVQALVCKESGMRANPECPETELRTFPVGRVPGPCRIHGSKAKEAPAPTDSPTAAAPAASQTPTEEILPTEEETGVPSTPATSGPAPPPETPAPGGTGAPPPSPEPTSTPLPLEPNG